MMKIGSLVQLSSYGNKIKLLGGYKGQTGLVINSYFESVLVQWSNCSSLRRMNRRDVKHVRL